MSTNYKKQPSEQMGSLSANGFSQRAQGLNRKERKTTSLYMPLSLPFCAPCVVFVFAVISLCAPCEKAVCRYLSRFAFVIPRSAL
jgi:hypothetical protein